MKTLLFSILFFVPFVHAEMSVDEEIMTQVVTLQNANRKVADYKKNVLVKMSKQDQEFLNSYLSQHGVVQFPEIVQKGMSLDYVSNGKSLAKLEVVSLADRKFMLNSYPLNLENKKSAKEILGYIERVMKSTSGKTSMWNFVLESAYASSEGGLFSGLVSTVSSALSGKEGPAKDVKEEVGDLFDDQKPIYKLSCTTDGPNIVSNYQMRVLVPFATTFREYTLSYQAPEGQQTSSYIAKSEKDPEGKFKFKSANLSDEYTIQKTLRTETFQIKGSKHIKLNAISAKDLKLEKQLVALSDSAKFKSLAEAAYKCCVQDSRSSSDYCQKTVSSYAPVRKDAPSSDGVSGVR